MHYLYHNRRKDKIKRVQKSNKKIKKQKLQKIHVFSMLYKRFMRDLRQTCNERVIKHKTI